MVVVVVVVGAVVGAVVVATPNAMRRLRIACGIKAPPVLLLARPTPGRVMGKVRGGGIKAILDK